MRGGSSNSGPAPDPNALRRERDAGDWHRLPAAGRTEPAPAWPLTQATKRENAHWIREWTRPQAVMWERMGLAVEVAMYVRTLARAEQPDSPVSLGTLVRQQQEALGLSLPGLARQKWVIDSGPTAPTPKVTPTDARRRARSRLKTIDGGAA